MVSLDKGLQLLNVKQKPLRQISGIQAGIFRHNQTYPGIIQAYSGIFRTLCYPDIFKTVVYPEL